MILKVKYPTVLGLGWIYSKGLKYVQWRITCVCSRNLEVALHKLSLELFANLETTAMNTIRSLETLKQVCNLETEL